ncbi:AAA family ATPase [Candidatus Margulisiibacteriota bacterium]
MRLKSLSLKNYRQYKDSMIEFDDGITGIVGLNGAGKSTIVEAIAWTLYGNNAARTGKEGIKRSTAPASASVETELVMEIGGTEYKIVRVLKGSSQTGAASIIASGKVIADSIRGVEKEINYLLGMDWKSFYTSFFAKQKELNALTDLTPAARRDTIIRMLRIDAVDRVVDSIKKQIKDKKLEIDTLKKAKTLKDANVLLSEKLVIEKNVKNQEKELAGVEKEIKKVETDLSKFKAKFNEERSVANKYNELDKKRTALEARLTGLSKRESELNDEFKEAAKHAKELSKLEKCYKEYISLEKEERKYSIAKESKIRTLENKREDLLNKYNELKENRSKLKAGQKCPTCGQKIENEAYIKEHFDKEMEKIKKEGQAVKLQLEGLRSEKKAKPKDTKTEIDDYSKIINRLEALQDSYDRYPMVKAKAEKKPQLETNLGRVTMERKDLESDLKKTLKELDIVPYDAKKHEQITEEFDTAKTALDKLFSSRNDLKLEIAQLAQAIKDKLKEIEEVKDTEEKIRSKTLSQEQQQRFINFVTDYRQFLISRIRPKLAEISGRLLSELTAGKYTGVELDEEYNLFIFDGNARYPLSRFSGGEADIANLCLRLSISQLIAESSGIEAGFIILDEIFGSQDAHRKISILEALNRLSKQFRQIILITHVEDIKDSVENIVEVMESEEGASYIKA